MEERGVERENEGREREREVSHCSAAFRWLG